MISGLSPRSGQNQPKSIKIRNQNSITFADDNLPQQNQPFKFFQNNTSPKNNQFLTSNFNQNLNDKNLATFSSEQWNQKMKTTESTISVSDLAKKLQNVSYTVLQAEYGSSFTENSSYFEWITQIKRQDSMDKLLHSYTSVLLTMIQFEQQQRLNSQPKFKHVSVDKSQRIKLKLILNQDEEKEVNKFKNKGFEGYMKKIEDQSERYKRQHFRIKERNRLLQNQLLKLSLEFKNKRELYITQISRLTEILHSSFMEVGKMFINVSNPSNHMYSNGFMSKYQNKNIPNYQEQRPVTPYSRKNIKSVSPLRSYQEKDYVKEEPKLPELIRPGVKAMSNYQSYLKPESVNQNKQEPFSIEKRTNRHFEVESESAIEERKKSQQKTSTLMLSVANYNRPKQSL